MAARPAVKHFFRDVITSDNWVTTDLPLLHVTLSQVPCSLSIDFHDKRLDKNWILQYRNDSHLFVKSFLSRQRFSYFWLRVSRVKAYPSIYILRVRDDKKL